MKNAKNWWDYHKWYVVCGAILLGILINLIGSALGLWHKKPDFQIAYVGRAQLPTDTISALEQAFASLAWDFNGDGQVIVQVNQYISGSQAPDPETAYYEYASELTLVGDISDCESYFFLMDQPENFQRSYQLLANPDGSCPPETDRSVEDKVVLWADCPVLSGMDLGSYATMVLGEELTGSSQELLRSLYLGRRCFFNDERTTDWEACSRLWDLLIQSKK